MKHQKSNNKRQFKQNKEEKQQHKENSEKENQREFSFVYSLLYHYKT